MAKRKKKPEEASKGQEGGFDEQLERLEGLVADLESGDLSLEEAMARFADGVKLLGACRQALAGYEERVEELTAEALDGLAGLSDEDEED